MKLKNISIRKKFLCLYIITACIMLFFEIINFSLVNRSINEIDQVISTNIGANKLSEELNAVQNALYEYLLSMNAKSLENYYRLSTEYQTRTEGLNDDIVDNEYLLCEKNIRDMSEAYLRLTDRAVMAKRGHNIEQYKLYYDQTTELCNMIQEYINTMNNKRLNENSERYRELCETLRQLEAFSIIGIIAIALICVCILNLYTGNIISPLLRLAKSAKEVSTGYYDIVVSESSVQDEVGIVIHTFNEMIRSIKEHMEYIKESTKKEREMKEKELRMEVLLKDARLKYLRAQINPHFLYNALNTCEQLAVLENADQTADFVDRMAYFFRYNVRRTVTDDNPLSDEIRAVDAYMYIQNVRFGGTMDMIKQIEPGVDSQIVPTMILQPIVENAVQHGLKEVDRQGQIVLSIKKKQKDGIELCISIKDNGCGMTREQIEKVLSDENKQMKEKELNKDTEGNIEVDTGGMSLEAEQDIQKQTGIGVSNVKERLELYYGSSGLMEIHSDGKDCGTEVILYIPENRKGE